MAPALFRDLPSWSPREFRRSLAGAGFNAEAIDNLIPGLGSAQNERAMTAAQACLAGDDTPLATAIRLFLLADNVPLEPVMNLFGWQVTELTRLGLLKQGNGGICSRVRVTPVEEDLVAADFPRRQIEHPDDFVMGVGPATRQLDALTPRLKSGRALEVGCGIAWLGARLARAGATVTASDINPRALELAAFNARLCGTEGIDLRRGSLFEPVEGEAPFDIIACNPPFVQTPDSTLTYRDSPSGNAFCRELVAGLPERLAPGGLAVVLLNWGHRDDEDWSTAPLSWLSGYGLQIWLNRSDCAGPAEYAWRWLQGDPRFAEPQAAAAALTRWIGHFRDRGMRRLSAGFLAIRKPADPDEPEWIRSDSRATGTLPGTAAHDLQRIFRNESWLRRAGAASPLIDFRYCAPEGIRGTVSLDFRSGWQRESIRLQSPGTLSYDGPVDENLMRLLDLVRSGNPPRALVDELESRAPSGKVPGLTDRVDSLTRELLRYGLLEPAP